LPLGVIDGADEGFGGVGRYGLVGDAAVHLLGAYQLAEMFERTPEAEGDRRGVEEGVRAAEALGGGRPVLVLEGVEPLESQLARRRLVGVRGLREGWQRREHAEEEERGEGSAEGHQKPRGSGGALTVGLAVGLGWLGGCGAVGTGRMACAGA